VGGADSIDVCQRSWLARGVLSAWGGLARPGFSPEGKQERGGPIPCAAGYFRFATLKCCIHRLLPGCGTCRRARRLGSVTASDLPAFSQTVSVTK
jgi:hypothetical protein